MATCIPAPACVAVRRQATRLWPDRSQASDGICASSTHTTQNPNSDHEPHVVYKGTAYATAVDLTDDKAAGCDADAWAEWLRTSRDGRVKYVICNRRMFSSYATSSCPAWTWRTYTGSNPHDKHAHVSILPSALFDDEPWFPQLEEDDMTADEREMLGRVHHELVHPDSTYNRSLREIRDALNLIVKGAEGYGILPTPLTVTKLARHFDV